MLPEKKKGKLNIDLTLQTQLVKINFLLCKYCNCSCSSCNSYKGSKSYGEGSEG